MTISQLTTDDKKHISLWKYKEEYARFNYAIEKNGWLDTYCKDECEYCFSAKLADKIIGLFLFIPQNENEFRVLINPDFLNKGYGKTLTSKALEIAVNQLAFHIVTLIVRQDHQVAITLYEKLEFKTTGEKIETIEGESIHFYKMQKSL